MNRRLLRRRYWLLYLVWLGLCAALFIALLGARDPSLAGRNLSEEQAGQRALSLLKSTDQARYSDYEVVSVAPVRKNHGGGPERWVVLCDRRPGTRLREAVVVEMNLDTGALIRIRPPGR
ncbi:MAG TPA: hypothetical protein VM534_01255 [Thermoanaerobaculia bacterium]|nr:hypothetical protein [Thermoanaerobaculia bacterium]